MVFSRLQSATLASLICGIVLPSLGVSSPLELHFGSKNSCYERIFNDEYLSQHPDQKVRRIRVDHFPQTFGTYDANGNIYFDPANPELYFIVSVVFQDSNLVLSDGGFCRPEGQTYHCRIECDGGGFFLKDRDANSILLINDNGFRVSGCGGSLVRALNPDPANNIFRLHRLPEVACVPPDFKSD